MADVGLPRTLPPLCMPPPLRVPRGRPVLGAAATTTAISVRVAAATYDRAYRFARRERISVPEVVRRGLARVLKDNDDDQGDR